MLYKPKQADIPPALLTRLKEAVENHQSQLQPMKSKPKQPEITFDAAALVARVEGFASDGNRRGNAR